MPKQGPALSIIEMVSRCTAAAMVAAMSSPALAAYVAAVHANNVETDVFFFVVQRRSQIRQA